MVVRLVLLLLLVLPGCASLFSDCDPPDEPVYACEPIPAGQPGCQGGPSIGGERDLDKTFPVGCEVRLPFCVESHPDSVQTCTCEGGQSPFGWSCPI